MLEKIAKIIVIFSMIIFSIILLDIFVQRHLVIKYELSTLISVISCLATMITAWLAINIARNWQSDKIKTTIFQGATEYLNFTNSIIATVTFLHKNLEARVEYLNHFFGNNQPLTQKDELTKESRNFANVTQELRYKSYQSLHQSLRYHNVSNPNYKKYVEELHLNFSVFLGLLEKPIVIDNGSFSINPDISKTKNAVLNDKNEDLATALTKLKTDDLIDLKSAIKNLLH
ncbi:hypothetical protein RI049_14630 [Cedecea neteri]|uniref:hypothetical protein n=1 Tax=Cedecea neteri TaxID=158822 RepID=UPI002AA7CCFD|nr:hypothetical protein [Cedecea neteri]WPU21316.1 hypothetical protein RI049_14630 [Cedecea neteri]